jgi:peptidoglycan/LPS O-acetylase OafA/YrhL
LAFSDTVGLRGALTVGVGRHNPEFFEEVSTMMKDLAPWKISLRRYEKDTILSKKGAANNFDSIRLMAAIGVLFSHSYPAVTGSNSKEPLYQLSGGQSTIGGLCVAIFFIISGYLITQSFHRKPSLLEYFTNRILRIVPALAVTTTLTCFLVGPIITTIPITKYFSSYLTWRYLGNSMIYPGAQKLPGVFEDNVYQFITNASIWTLPYEFTCYIIVAGLGLIFCKRWISGAFVLGLALASIFFTYITGEIFIEFGSYFLCGAIVHFAQRWIVLDLRIFIVALMALYIFAILGSGFKSAICIFGSYAIFYLAYARLPRFFNLARHGDLSYGTYLYAWPTQQILSPITSEPLANFLLSLPIVLALAWASWRMIEQPTLSRKARVSRTLREKYSEIVRIE